MLNIVIPMAGAGSRFSKAGYSDPKPLIPVNGKPMIQAVVNNLSPVGIDHKFTFICQEQHVKDYKLDELLAKVTDKPNVITINGITEGAAVTVLKAREVIDNEDPLVIANCDQWVDANFTEFVTQLMQCDGNVMTMQANDPKWSFVEFKDGKPSAIREKQVVSDVATVGIYGFRRGCDFVNAAQRMIDNNLRVNNEFYVAPTYNEMFDLGSNIELFHIEGMYGIGTPEDLDYFLSLPISKRA
jgi:NDP-sugar pyrophosphorylase family protein